jgi:hypothetical protein
MVRFAGVMPATGRLQAPLPARLPDEGPSREAKEFLARARDNSGTASSVEDRALSATSHASPAPSAATGTDARIEKLLHLLEGTVEENRRLRETQAETNRDLMELQFRVDMYDGEFRPLKVEEDPTVSPYDDGNGGVLPPLE